MKCSIIILLILMGLLASVGFAQSPVASQQKATPLEKYLNPDGTINTKSGFKGSLDPKGYRMVTGPNGEPRFVQPKKISSTNIDFEDSGWDPRFTSPGTNGNVYAIYVDSYYGNVYVGGGFTYVGGLSTNNIAVWRGTQWDSLGSGIVGQVSAISLYEVGLSRYIVAGGSITKAGGITVNNIAKWDLDSKSWSTLGTGVNGPVSALAYQTAGSNLYVGGNFTTAGSVTVNNIARYNGSWHQMSNGGNIGMDGSVMALYVDAGAVYAGGLFTTAGGVTVNGIAKWSSSTWTALGTGLSGGYLGTAARAIIKVGSYIYVGGDFSSAGGVTAFKIARWDGVSWYTIGGDFTEDYDAVYALATDGTNLYAGGSLKTPWDQNNVYRWDGTTWYSLGGTGYWDNIYALAMYRQDYYFPEQYLRTNTLCVGGQFITIGGLQSQSFTTWFDNEWSASGNGVDDEVFAMASDGNNLYVGGLFVYAGGLKVSSIAKWNGTRWDSLGGGTNGEVRAIAVIGTDVYVGGWFSSAGGVSANNIAMWDGSDWNALNSGVNSGVLALSVMGTDLYVGGNFTMAGGSSANRIAKWDGSNWSALDLGTNGSVYAITINGTNVYVGGSFTTAGPVSANRIARWNGSNWFALGSGMNTHVLALATVGPYLYAGGVFTTAGGVSAISIAKWDGLAWSGLGTDMGTTDVLALAASGTDLYVSCAGSIEAGGITTESIARWDGTTWDSLESGVHGDLWALASYRGAIFAGGGFPSVGKLQSSLIARWGLPYKTGGMIAGRVFIDENMNGAYDTGEPGGGSYISISRSDDPFNYYNSVCDAYGYYYYDGLPDGDYIVTYVPFLYEKVSYPPTLNNTYLVTITDGNAVVDKDFGIYNLQVAYYFLAGDAHEALGHYGDMTLVNTPFVGGGGIYSDGNYPTTDARTPNLTGIDFSNFSIAAHFSISEYPTLYMPVFVGGLSSRWIGFLIQPDGTVAMKYNNSSIEGSSVMCSLNDFHTALVTYNSVTSMGKFYLDGILVGSASFALSFAPADKVVSIEDLSVSRAFKGNLYGLFVANADMSPEYVETPVSTINGIVFNDLNGNGSQDGGETGLAGWLVHLRTGNPADDRDTTTDANGRYTFTTEYTGVVKVTESTPDDWIQTYPPPPGEHIFSLGDPRTINGIDFGNKGGYRYIGPSGGNWSKPANWSGGHVPQPDEIVVIPVNVFVDALPNDSIMGLRILSGATLTFSASAPPLKITGGVKIGGGGAIVFPSSMAVGKSLDLDSPTLGMICYSDWINLGTFTAGHSTVMFAGDASKKIGSTNFYNLELSGLNATTNGNLEVTNNLILHKSFEVSEKDTVVITNTDTSAIQDTGRIIRGTIRRSIAPGETGSYRFESPLSFVKFDGTGTYPSAVTMTTTPDETPPIFGLNWQLVGGVVDTVENIITYDSAKHFSKWVFGTPRPGSPADPTNVQSIPDADILEQMETGTPLIRRLYTISAVGGSNYQARLRLRYDQSEVPIGISEADLRLLRGPFFIDSVSAQWNMVSLSLIPDSTEKDIVFPASSSNAFAYDGGYIERTILNFGEGYWLKFPTATQVVISGEDRDSLTLPVKVGWNIIGAISYPVSAASVTSVPPGIIASEFYGYETSYQPADSIKPLHAYWVKTSSAGSLFLSSSDEIMMTKEVFSAPSLDNLNILDVIDAAKNEQRLYYGSDSLLEPDRYMMPPIPPAGMFDVRYSTERLVEFSDNKMDKVLTLKISSALYPINLQWKINDPKTEALLNVGDEETSLITNGQFIVTNPDVEIRLRIISQVDKEFPKEYGLYQNYPNPFNPTTTIRFDLPVVALVTLKLYNILGQEVAVLVNQEQMNAGTREIEFDAKSFASGVYFYRIIATGAQGKGTTFTSVKRMILLK